MSSRQSLNSACLHFFGIFYENPPPGGCDEGAWDRLDRAARRLFERSAELEDRRSSFGLRRRALGLMARDCRAALRLLGELPRDQALVEKAWRYLDQIVVALAEEDERLVAPDFN